MGHSSLDKVMQHVRSLAAGQIATDNELLRAFLASNDQAAFAALAKRHGPLVFSVCRRLLGNLHDAEDAFQSTFVVLARQAPKLADKGCLSSWLHGVAYRIALHARRAAARRRGHERQARAMHTANPAWQAAWHEVQLLLDEEIQRLPEKYREPFILCCLENQSSAVAARRLGIKEGTVRSRLTEARKRLQARLSRRGVDLTAVLGAAAVAADAATAMPPTLLATTVSMATKATAVPASVIALVKGATANLAIRMVKVGASLFVAFALVGTAGMWAWQHGNEQRPGARTVGNEKLGTASDKERLNKKDLPAVDAFGDSLPEGAVARLGARRFRHEENADALVFTRDGKTLVGHTGSGVILWDAASGKERQRLPVRMPMHASIDVSPDGNTLAISGNAYVRTGGGPKEKTEISLWDARSAKKTRTVALPYPEPKNTASIIRLFFTRDGKSLVLCDLVGRITVIDPISGQARFSLGSDNLRFLGGAVSPDNRLLAAAVYPKNEKAAKEKNSLQLWDMATGKFVRTVCRLPAKRYVVATAFSPTGTTLAYSDLSRVFLHDVATGDELGELAGMKGNEELAFTPDGKKLLTGGFSSLFGRGYDRKIRVWDLATRKALHVFSERVSEGLSMALSPDGGTVALGSCGLSIQLWDVATGKELFTEFQGHDSEIRSLTFSHDGKTLFSGGEFPPIVLWDTKTWQMIGKLSGSARTLSLSPERSHLVTIPGQQRERHANVKVWDVRAGKEAFAFTIPHSWDVSAAFYSKDGGKVYTLDRSKPPDTNTFFVRQWTADSGKQEEQWTIKTDSWDMSLAPDAKTMFGARLPGGLVLYDVKSGSARLLPGPNEQPNFPPVPSPDGRMLISCKWADSPIRLWELVTRREIMTLQGHQGMVLSVCWSPNGRLVASGDYKKTVENATQTVRLWDAASGRQLAVFGGFAADVTALAFTPDCKCLVAGLRNTTILVFDISKATKATQDARVDKIDLDGLWTALASDNPAQAHQAIGSFVSSPKHAALFLREHLKPVPVADPAKIQTWVSELDSDKFAVRQSAAKQLEKIGAQVQPFVQKALKANTSLETRRRLEQLSNTLSDVPRKEAVRVIRAIMALERIGSPEALAVLAALAKGAPGARETDEAQASVERLKRRAPPTP